MIAAFSSLTASAQVEVKESKNSKAPEVVAGPKPPANVRTPAYSLNFESHSGDFSNPYNTKVNGLRRVSITTYLPLDAATEFHVRFTGGGANKAQAWLVDPDGKRSPLSVGSNEGHHKAGAYRLELLGPKRGAFTASIVGKGGPSSPPAGDADLCTALDYLIQHTPDGFEELRIPRQMPEDALANAAVKGLLGEEILNFTLPGAIGQKLGRTKVDTNLWVGTDETERSTVASTLEATLSGCFAGLATQENEERAPYESSILAEPTPAKMMRGNMYVRKVTWTGHYAGWVVELWEKDYPKDDSDIVTVIVRRALRR